MKHFEFYNKLPYSVDESMIAYNQTRDPYVCNFLIYWLYIIAVHEVATMRQFKNVGLTFY